MKSARDLQDEVLAALEWLRGFFYGVYLPFVHAILAGIDQRRADVVMEICPLPAERTRDEAELRNAHRGPDLCCQRVASKP
jgi:hypothetical protein